MRGPGWLALALLLTSCRDPQLDQLQRVRAAACRCHDAACVDAALAQLPAKGPRDKHQGQRLAAEILQCLARVGEEAPEVDAGVAPDAGGTGDAAAATDAAASKAR